MSLVSGTGDDLATMLYSKDSTSLTHISPMALNLELDNASSENGHPVFGGYATTTTELKALVQRVMRLKSSKLLFNSVHGRSSETKLITKSPSSLSPVVLKITEKKKKAESSQKKRFSNLKQFDRCPGKETIRLPKTSAPLLLILRTIHTLIKTQSARCFYKDMSGISRHQTSPTMIRHASLCLSEFQEYISLIVAACWLYLSL
jgi:hypothetical protein